MVDGERPYPHLEGHASSRERSMAGHVVDSTDDNSGISINNPLPPPPGIFRQGSLGGGVSPFSIQRQISFSNSLTPRHSVSQDNNIQNNNNHYVSSALSGPPVTLNTTPAQPIIHDHVLASSPVSSVSAPSTSSALVSAGGNGGVLDRNQNFDSQIKTSPFLHDILDRVIRTEYAQRDLSRELGVLTSKINFLVERFEQADSRRSFSASPIPAMGNHNMSISPLGGNGLHRESIGGGSGRDDGDISKRLDALTSSVQQILMIQQHGHNNGGNSGSHHHPPFHGNGPLSPSSGGPGPNGFDGMPPNMNMGNGTGIMGGPNRPHGRNPPPPVRTWSAGSLDMPLRGDAHLPRPELLNQKRRSVVGNLNRRDSAAVRALLYPMTRL